MRTSVYYNDTEIKFRIITYKVDDVNYYLGTTLLNHILKIYIGNYGILKRILEN